jgi:hypothetical protein
MSTWRQLTFCYRPLSAALQHRNIFDNICNIPLQDMRDYKTVPANQQQQQQHSVSTTATTTTLGVNNSN